MVLGIMSFFMVAVRAVRPARGRSMVALASIVASGGRGTERDGSGRGKRWCFGDV